MKLSTETIACHAERRNAECCKYDEQEGVVQGREKAIARAAPKFRPTEISAAASPKPTTSSN